MAASSRNILSYFKETKEKQPAKRLKLDETLIQPKPEPAVEPEQTSSVAQYTKLLVKAEQKSTVKQVSIKEAFSRAKKVESAGETVLTITEEKEAIFKSLEGTPRQPVELVNNRKRRNESNSDEITPSGKPPAIECLSRPLRNGTPASAKKRLIMEDPVTPTVEKEKEPKPLSDDNTSRKTETGDLKQVDDDGVSKKVPFTLKGPLSPVRSTVEVHIARVNCTPENTKTPVKRIPVNPDIKSPRAKQLFGSPSKKLNPQEVRAKLGKVGKLADLQARLASVNENLQKLHSFKEAQKLLQSPKKAEEKKDLRKFESLDVEVPASPRKLESPRKIEPSPVKAETPAFERYQHLVEAGLPTLTLPYKFKVLAEIFRCMDVVCSFMYNRQELITFKKLKAGVQEMLRRDFTKHHVRQVVAVYPGSYRISYEKIQQRFVHASPGKDEHQMILTPLIESKEAATPAPGKGASNIRMLDFKPMPPTALLERRTMFHSRLLAIVKQHHADYLASLIPPVVVPEEKLTKWHPCFPLDEIPEIDPERLPESPVKNKLGSAKEILETAHTLLAKNPRVLEALKSAADREASTSKNTVAESQKLQEPPAPLNPALKGVPQALLDKIRAKEAEKMKVAMTQNPDDIKAGQMAGRLPELVRTISHIFVTDKKPAMVKELLCKRIVESTKLVATHAIAEEHIQLLSKVVPDWLKLHQLQGKTYVKINRQSDINAVVAALEKYKKSCV